MAVDYFSQISYLAIETNSTCNLSCLSCNRSDVRKNEKNKVLELKEFKNILENFKACPVDTMKLQGLNEPLLHPEFDECVMLAREYFPNAFLITATNLQYDLDLEKLDRILNKIDLIYLSIDGVNNNYESARPPSSFAKLLMNIDLISKSISKKEKLVINFTAVEENIDDLDEIYRISTDYGLGGVRINVAQNWNEHQVSSHNYPDDFVDKLKKYSDDVQGVARWIFSDCFWPSEGVFIDVYGNIKSCLLNTSQFPLGNLWRDNVKDIYNNSKQYQFLRSSLLSNIPGKRCQNCDYAVLPATLKKVGGAVMQREARPFLRIINTLESRASGSNILFVERRNQKFVRKWVGHESEKMQDQYRWLDLFKGDSFVPEVTWQYHSPAYSGYEMEMISGAQKFSDLIFRKDPSTFMIFDQILDTLKKIHCKGIDTSVPDDPSLYYQRKLLDKMKEARDNSPTIKRLMGQKSLLINGNHLDNFDHLLKKIGKKRFVDLLATGERALIHGDFTAENLLVTSQEKVIVIDPNNENLISTPLVDYAKLFQSLKCGYEEIPNLDIYNFKDHEINFRFKNNPVRDRLCKLAWENIPKEHHTAVNAHLVIHFARLLPYQIRSDSTLLPVYYGILVLLLDEINESLKESDHA